MCSPPVMSFWSHPLLPIDHFLWHLAFVSCKTSSSPPRYPLSNDCLSCWVINSNVRVIRWGLTEVRLVWFKHLIFVLCVLCCAMYVAGYTCYILLLYNMFLNVFLFCIKQRCLMSFFCIFQLMYVISKEIASSESSCSSDCFCYQAA